MPITGHIKHTSKNGGIEALKKNTQPAVVKVGVLSGAGEHNKGEHGQTVVEIAFWNEYGTKHIPARPFLGPTIRKNGRDYKRLMRRLMKDMLKGKVKSSVAQGKLGLLVQRDIQAAIVALKTPPKSDATLRMNPGKTNPLIDTGQLRQSISWAPWSP